MVWLGLVVTAVFAYLAVRDVRFADVWHALRASNYWWLVPALFALAIAIFMRALRWRFLFAASTRPPTAAVTEALLIGYLFNNILPVRAGEAARVVALRRRAGTRASEALATVVAERAYDVLSLLLLLFVLLAWLPPVSWLHAAVVLAVVLAVGFGAAVIVLARYGERPLHVALKPLELLPFVSADLARAAAQSGARGLASLREARLGLAAVLWTVSSWVVMGVSCWCVMRGFDLGLSPIAGIFVVIATGLSMILPSSPAALGVFEAAAIAALKPYGVSHADALSYALVLHALNFFPFIVAGAIALQLGATTGRRRARRGGVAPVLESRADDGVGRAYE
jgi:uncharacterized membrane protein YbhN (UPF0104 family)